MNFFRFSEYSALVICIALALLALSGTAQAAPQFLDDEAEPHINIAFTVQPANTGRFTLIFDWQNAKNFYALDCTPGEAELRAVKNGVTEPLAATRVAWRDGSRVTLKRRPWLMQLIVDNTVVLTAYDAAFEDGQIGTIAEGGWSWKEARIQPVEPVYFADDFTRAQGEGNVWQVNGAWTLTASSENITTANSQQSSNPFSYQAQTPNGLAQANAGRWFWDNYEAQVSARPNGRGTIGLAAYVQDGGRDYLALLWDGNEGPAARRLVRVVDGKATTLLQAPGAYLPRQWYRLAIRTSPGYVEAFIDGVPIFRARDASFGQGGIALLAQNIGAAHFDDVKVRSYDYFRQDFSLPGTLSAGGAWQPLDGVWSTQSGAVATLPVKGDYIGRTRVLLAGRSEWNGYTVSSSVAVGEKGGGGLVAGYQDAGNYIVFRWAGEQSTLPFKGRQQLLRYHGGKATIVSDQPATILAKTNDDDWAHVTLRYTAGALTVYAGDELIAQTADETLASGRAGLYAQGLSPVRFRDVTVFFPPEPEKPKVAPKMEDDSYMVGWASAAGEWPPTKTKGGLEYWNTGEFFGDARVLYPWQSEAFKSGKLEVSLGARRGEFFSGLVVRAEGTGSPQKLKLAIASDGEPLRTTEVDLTELAAAGDEDSPPDVVPLRIEREGRSLLVTAGGQPVLSYLPSDEEPSADGTRIAARTVDMPLRAQELIAFSSNRDDYTFTEAPTDWYSPQGSWSVFSRWPCFNNWSFFGGQGIAPVLWSKRTYGGDVVVEIYTHNQMDLPKDIGYSHAGDLNITLGGDGKNPASGYSFVTAGWANTRSAILKGTQIVAQSREPHARFTKPTNTNSSYHKRWFYIRAETRHTEKDGKPGVMARLWLDDKLLAEYFDPQPLAGVNGGRVAFWSTDGTMMIARAKIEAEKMGPRRLPAGLIDAEAALPSPRSGDNHLAPVPVVADALPTAVVEAGAGDNEWLVRNPASGGLFAVELRQPGEINGPGTPWRVKDGSQIEMEIALSDESRVDMYARVNGALHLIEINGGQRLDAKARKIGAFSGNQQVAGSEWRRLSFDIGAALKKTYPSEREWKIEALQIGALHGDSYRWNGFYGNSLGASYRLRNAQLAE